MFKRTIITITFSLLLCLATSNLQSIVAEDNALTASASKHDHVVYHHITNYSRYLDLFREKAGDKNTIEMTSHGTGVETCQGSPCRFYIFLYQPQQEVTHTIFISSGLHGNERIGPTSLLYAYDLLKPKSTRIIYFPIGNPSGYSLNQRNTFPNNLDPNRDYPIDGNLNCYQTSATRIIDYIYRTYPIDLTLNLHNGGDEIGWNWGTYAYAQNPRTEEYDIDLSLGEMARFYGGFNKRLKIRQFKIGIMSDVVYPAVGTLDDWAYAGSWDSTVPKKCKKYQYARYPAEMHKGLVFLFELGMHKSPENKLGTSEGLDQSPVSTSDSNGYITRTIRILQSMTMVFNPEIVAIINQSRIYIKVRGCEMVDFANISLSSNQKSVQTHNVHFSVIGDSQYSFVNVGKIELAKRDLSLLVDEGKQMIVGYELECDKDWRGKGKTAFGKSRNFKGEIVVSKKDIVGAEGVKDFFTVAGKSSKSSVSIFVFLIIPLILLSALLKKVWDREKKNGGEGKEQGKEKKMVKIESEGSMMTEEEEQGSGYESPEKEIEEIEDMGMDS